MPRAKIETAFLGAYTIVALDAATENVAGWLIKRLCAWILRDELPDAIPPELASVWAVIEAESRNLHDYRKSKDEARTEAAKTAAAVRWNANASERTQKNANASERIANECEAMPEIETEKETENKMETYSEPNPKARATSASASASVFTDLDSLDWFTLPERALVDRALALIGEEGNARMAGRLRKARRILGLPAFRELLATFDSELRAGEVPANKGATLNARLSAREALG